MMESIKEDFQKKYAEDIKRVKQEEEESKLKADAEAKEKAEAAK